MSQQATEGSGMSAHLRQLADSLTRGIYEISAEKVAAAILEWHVGDRLGDQGLLLRIRVSPTSP